MKLRLKSSVRITLLYFIIGLFWIALSDYALLLFNNQPMPVNFFTYQLVKGSIYVALTSVLLYVLIEKHSQRLRHKIEEAESLNQRLKQYAAELEYSNQELEQFSYITSHDLQEPLRNITSFLKRLEQKCSGTMDDRAHKYIHYAVAASNRMRRLIRDTLALHRIRESAEPEFEATPVNQAVQESLLLLRKQIEHKQAYIILKPLPWLLSNESLLIELFHILIGNSLIYQRQGVPPAIYIFADEHKHHWNFFVRDNGIGIEDAQKETIFQVFRRLHAQNEYTESGTGVGLAMARKIVQRLNGSIHLAPHPAGEPGCTFCISLPKRHDEASSAAAEKA
jgi:light-regulated signal transduction histidine kinase (bacteriophytochrome)